MVAGAFKIDWVPICFPGCSKPDPRALTFLFLLSPAPGRRGPVALVSEVFEQHLGGHILQVRSLPSPLLRASTWWSHPGIASIPHPFPASVPCEELELRSLVPVPFSWGQGSLSPDGHPDFRIRFLTPVPFLSTLVSGWLRVRLEPGRKIPLHLRDGVHLSGSLTGNNPAVGCRYAWLMHALALCWSH